MEIKKISIWVVALCILSLVISCAGDKPSKTTRKMSAEESKVIRSASVENNNAAGEVEKKDEKKQDQDEGTPPEQIKKAKELIASLSNEKLAAMKPKKLFKNYCSICHGYKGNMKINGAKDLTKSVLSLEESVAQVYHGKGLMTPFKGIMKDDEIVAVSKYLKELRK